jgi:hypothetical protein
MRLPCSVRPLAAISNGLLGRIKPGMGLTAMAAPAMMNFPVSSVARTSNIFPPERKGRLMVNLRHAFYKPTAFTILAGAMFFFGKSCEIPCFSRNFLMPQLRAG